MNKRNNVFLARARAKYLYENVTPWTDEIMTIIKNEFDLSHKHYSIVRSDLAWWRDRLYYLCGLSGLVISLSIIMGII